MKLIHLILTLALCAVLPFYSRAQSVKILFDNTKSETASNADWQIDADQFNLFGNEANPARYPTPAQSTVTAATPETYWNGSLSSWGIACAKLGYQVETLPASGKITYGSTTNAQDLSHYNLFVVDEPNNQFSAAEKTAIISYVRGGGNLFIISDHDQSDRDNDGWDSPHIWNDLMSADPFGFQFDLVNISGTYNNPLVTASDSILHGRNGAVAGIKYSNGTTMHTTGTNAAAAGLLYTSTGNAGESTEIVCLKAKVGSGKIVSIGDSSPMDDGTGDTHDNLYVGWTDLFGNHARLIMNATIWLVSRPITEISPAMPDLGWSLCSTDAGIYSTLVTEPQPVDRLEVYSTLGQLLVSVPAAAAQTVTLPAAGFYIVRLCTPNTVVSKSLVFGR